MKRRSEGGLDDAVNMDVMMDNMTDVVGTLLMVLIIVQLKVNNTIDQIQSSLPKVTQEQSQDAQQEAAELEKQMNMAQANWVQREPDSAKVFEDLRAKQEDVKRHETTLEQGKVNLVALDKLKQQLEERRKQVEATKKEMAALIDEREKLKGLLDNAPVAEAPPAKIVRMPEARAIPTGAELTKVLCSGGKVYLVDPDVMKNLALNALGKARKTLIKEERPPKNDKDMSLYDHEKSVALLEKRSLGNADYDLKFPIIKTAERLRVDIYPKKSAGETPEKFDSLRSQFANVVRSVKRNPKGVVWFLVHPDSFETYLAAREMCDQVGAPAGWEMWGAPFFIEYLSDYQVNRLEDPPPPNPDALVIPAPKKTID